MATLQDSLASLLQVPGLQELLNQSITQQRQQAPLRTAVNQQAANMLPNSAFPGGRPNMSSIAPANFSTPAPGGIDWSKWLPIIAASLAGGSALSKILGGNPSGAGGNLGNIVNGLKKLFGGGGGSVQGNQPFAGGALTGPNAFDPSNFMGWANAPDQGPLPPLTSDPGVYYGPGGGGASPTNPSGGTGVGPGMQDFYDSGGSQGSSDDGGE